MTLGSIVLMSRRRGRIARSSHARGDDFPVFAPREWADLPTHHSRKG